MWLKFTVVWRFFRLASLAAGVDAPENIRRCFANNYDIEVCSICAWHFRAGPTVADLFAFMPSLGLSKQQACAVST